jgi:hypothetical protein
MTLFATKTWQNRLKETIEFISKKTQNAVVEKIHGWERYATAWEKERIAEGMHQGVGMSDKAERAYRRALILMRAAILRHDLSKVKREVNGYNAVTLATHFDRIARECANHQDVVAPWADRVKVEEQNKKRAEMLERAIKDWEKTPEHQLVASFTEKQKKIYDDYTKEKARTALILPVITYQPVPDATDQSMVKTVNTVAQGGQNKKRGEGGLRALENGGELYIVGHGNLGSAIGTHDESLGARKLVEALAGDGLPKAPQAPIWIYLFACWTGTHTRRAYGGLGKREPYARRFAKALANNGFSGLYVIGFAGSVEADKLAQDYDMRLRGQNAQQQFRRSAADLYVVYHVSGGDFNRVHGQDWTTKATRVEGFTTAKITVRPRGGAHNAT